eukprot:scaffold4431_cov111-Isochrysis_galbana.AAC.1
MFACFLLALTTYWTDIAKPYNRQPYTGCRASLVHLLFIVCSAACLLHAGVGSKGKYTRGGGGGGGGRSKSGGYIIGAKGMRSGSSTPTNSVWRYTLKRFADLALALAHEARMTQLLAISRGEPPPSLNMHKARL